jgi:phage/plasmid-associated DNA primase
VDWEHELPGLLNRAIEGLARLRQHGRFQQLTNCMKAQDEWLAQANLLSAFLNDKCTPSAGNHVPLPAFYEDMKTWRTRMEYEECPLILP